MSSRSWWLPRQANTLVGGGLIAILAAMIVIGLFWLPHDPLALDLRARLAPPSAEHLLGTDEFGRDVFSRAVRGAQISMLIAVLTVCFAVLVGSVVGLVAGYIRGWLDRTLMIANDALLAFPGVLLALALMVIVGGSRSGLILALGIAYTPPVVRVVRSTVLSLREREFVEASRVLGNSQVYTMLRHVLPNAVAPIAVLATSMFGWVLLSESALSFLGLGIAPPAPTWGNMLAASRPFLTQAVWLSLVPGACISLTLIGINLLGDALRDRLDPRTVGR
jgi:peptide/nickel transport system permease protein